MSKRIRCAIVALVVAVLLAASPAGPYVWDLVDDRVNVPYMRDCRGLGRHPSECR